MIGFCVLIPVALLSAFIWPHIQDGITWISQALANIGPIGIWCYTLLEKALLPFGLHHFLYFPIYYDNIIVDGGIYAKWLQDLPMLASSTDLLRDLAPYSGFQMTALSSIFGAPGIALAFYFTTKKFKRKKLLALLIPLVFTASFCAITEPIEFTFLFVAPPLFFVHAILGACLTTTAYLFGIVGSMAGNLFEQLAINYIPLWPNHWTQYLVLIVIGLCYMGLYFIIFRFLILKFDFKTPGRDDFDNSKGNNLTEDYSSIKELKKAIAEGKEEPSALDKYEEAIMPFEEKIMRALGGARNVNSIINCSTRILVNVEDPYKVTTDKGFKVIGAHGAKKNGNNVQIVVGLHAQSVREGLEKIMYREKY